MTRCAPFLLLFCVTAAALPSRAAEDDGARPAIAVVVHLPDQAPIHRDVAAAIVQAVATRFAILEPSLSEGDVSACQADLACEHRLAQSRGAALLLSISIGGAGTRDYLISQQVVDGGGATVFDKTQLSAASEDPFLDGRRGADALLGFLEKHGAALPASTARAPAAASILSWAGVAVFGGALVTGAVSASILATLVASGQPAAAVTGTALVGGGALALFSAVGAGLLVADAWGDG